MPDRIIVTLGPLGRGFYAPEVPPNWNLGASRRGGKRKAWWPGPALRNFPNPSHAAQERTHCNRFSSLASQHMPSSCGSLRLAVNRFASTETQSWAASPPLARTEGIIPSECHLITCSGIKPDGERPHHSGPTCQGSRSQGFQVCSFQSIIHQSTTPGRHVFTLACPQHVCRMEARWRSERS